MTFLEICKAVCREAGIAGGENAITTVIGNVGQINRVVNYVRNALIEIESAHMSDGDYLRYMRRPFTLTTVADQAAYAYDSAAIVDDLLAAAIPRFTCWLVQDPEFPPRSYLQSAGVGTQGYLVFLPWPDFVRRYRIGTQVSNVPFHVTIDPQNNLVLGPTPNAIFIVQADYLIGPQVMTVAEDEPAMPAAYHDVITYRALRNYGLFENAPEIVTYADDSFATWMGMLEGNQLPMLAMAGPLC
jgi:hypothetical protein